MTPKLNEIWVYLAASPLLGLTATLLAYQLASLIYQRARFNPLANPVAIAVAILVLVLTLTGTSYKTYFDGAQFVHFLLGPATVALAIPLYQQLPALRRDWFALLVGMLAGSTAAIATAMGVAWALGASPVTILSLAPKSVTSPIAMGIAEKIGGLPSLTAVMVIATGILGATLARTILTWMKFTDHKVMGFALGVTAHGIGTARGFQVSEEMGAFAGLAMGLSGVMTALLLPLGLKLLGVI
ncbi:LrgB family protein [Actimicrobium sp. CCC2.4]|uniref:LrgB family protein n=1 Tax=Actimicrobium sp. CCC2.4 TaxID=3048606 RepID=UPI002AC96012|nr:LrgB family protein [Actimicrobium sp. CCC2.4]MEB0135090.1 LrgB family protein [Actimicrobium sp. CCC2.4]WPX31863.1 LrgB family protein [Actimicrobium sp. CCC2.4]